jgi:hypothetical protein
VSISCVYVLLITRGTLLAVRWDRLFDDLEAQLDRAAEDEFDAEVADRTRREVARIRLADRLRCAVGSTVDLDLEGAGPLTGVVRRAGIDWLLLESSPRPQVVVSQRAIMSVRGLTLAGREPDSWGAVESRIDLGQVLRAVARDRSTVTAILRSGSNWVGTIDRVGADFLELAEHGAGEARRAGQVRGMRLLSTAALAMIRPE